MASSSILDEGGTPEAMGGGASPVFCMLEVAPARPIPLPPLKDHPLVSVLIASYNHAAYVEEAIHSVLAQTYQDFELIICDDGSEDTSPDIIQRFVERNPRVQLIRQENRGAAAALNAAYSRARGDVLCFLDSDDFFAPDKLRLVIAGLRRENAGLLIHTMMTVDAAGRPLGRLPLAPLERGWLAPRLERRGGRWNPPPTSAICLRREAGRFAFPLPTAFGTWGKDNFVTTLLALLTPVAALDSSLTYYRIHGGNVWHGRRMDAARFEQAMLADEQTGVEVNQRLVALGFPGLQLDLSRSLTLRQNRLVLDLLRRSASRRALARAYRSLIGAMWTDESAGWLGRLRSVVALGLAVLLPARWRAVWLTEFFSHTSRLRLVTSRVLRQFARREPSR